MSKRRTGRKSRAPSKSGRATPRSAPSPRQRARATSRPEPSARQRARPATARVSFQIPRPSISEHLDHRMIPQFEPGDPRAPLATPEGSPGEYEITAVLGIPGVNGVLTDFDLEKLLNAGDSLLRLPPGAAEIRV